MDAQVDAMPVRLDVDYGAVMRLLGYDLPSGAVEPGGVDATRQSIEERFSAGVACVGIGSRLIRKDLVAAGDWKGITSQVRQLLEWIKEARGKAS